VPEAAVVETGNTTDEQEVEIMIALTERADDDVNAQALGRIAI
jgi:hypothetical protein